ncbi:uncharacterized protein LOC126987866 [Eriocheir sinensis]|uniref:uncharacterized protein LOC126987866 n=1 Tax=Eriocheir sinensis TaxID=95602 RepID=UPI0021C6BB0A|nr:uncharacterized protein LOC126987866 [Eriocheir sinensis]
MSGCLGAAGCLLVAAWAVATSGQNVTTQVVVDFVQFYRHRDVYVMDSALGSSWAADTYLALATRTAALAAVVPLASLGETHGWPRANVSPLMVALLPSPRHAAALAQVFPRAPSWSSWLLLLPSPDLTPWLEPLTLLLDSMVTVAVIPPESASATLWQVYQVAPGMDKRLLHAGRWLLPTPEADKELARVRGQMMPRDRLEERKVTFGRMLGVVGDPLLRREDLSGLQLTCSTIHEPPNTLLKPRQYGTVIVTGIFGDVVTTLQQITNFTV